MRRRKLKHTERLRGVVPKGFLEILAHYNLIFLIVVLVVAYFALLFLRLNRSKVESIEVLDYLNRVEASLKDIYEIPQSFMQEAMEEILPVSQRTH